MRVRTKIVAHDNESRRGLVIGTDNEAKLEQFLLVYITLLNLIKNYLAKINISNKHFLKEPMFK